MKLGLLAALMSWSLGCGRVENDGPPGGAGGGEVAGAGGAGAAGGGACACSPTFESQACFCADGILASVCARDVDIDDVLEPACPGPLIHPISPSCAVGGVFFPLDDLRLAANGYFFDRDTGALVGLYYSTDVEEVCGVSSTARWGNVMADCELCDPCGVDPEFPACPEPRK